ncbi:hypothetical protein PSHT_06373 [Puccinia striiformis]|uniref:Uncharacterized protein n=1 Tax=Puccinia striiformis TaxID=27350 RepID=A0A2S4W6U4_9BASI|nr:hypothetical protein PSHT_06373 [Puccinia striiformis]
MSQAIVEAPATQSYAGRNVESGQIMPTSLELHRLGLLQAASHHLPSFPPSNPWDCLAFRQISHRLIGWDRLYLNEPAKNISFKTTSMSLVSDPNCCTPFSPVRFSTGSLDRPYQIQPDEEHPDRSKVDKHGQQQVEETRSNETSSSYDAATDSSIVNSDDCQEEDDGHEGLISAPLPLSQLPSSLQPGMIPRPTIDNLDSHQFDSYSCHQVVITNPSTTTSSSPSSSISSNPRCRKSHPIESSFDGLVDFKRRKILPA